MAKKTRRYMACVQIPEFIRDQILETFRPMHDAVYCRHITLAYDCGETYEPSHQPMVVTVLGHLTGADAEALAVSVNGRGTGDNSQPYHITLSVPAGVRPSIVKERMLRGQMNFEPWNGKPIRFAARPVKEFLHTIEPDTNIWREVA